MRNTLTKKEMAEFCGKISWKMNVRPDRAEWTLEQWVNFYYKMKKNILTGHYLST